MGGLTEGQDAADILPPKHLTKRELEVLRLLADSLTAKEVAATLYLSVRTVHFHIANIFEKLGVRNRVKAIMMYVKDEIGPDGTILQKEIEKAIDEA